MTPSVPRDYVLNGALWRVPSLPNLFARYAIRGCFPDRQNVGISQLCHAVGIALKDRFRMGIYALPMLAYHIRHVVVMRAEKQMGRIAASPVVAMVADKHAFWNRTVGQDIGHAMRFYVSAAMAAPAKMPISNRVERCGPRPASIVASRFVNFGPEPFFDAPSSMGIATLPRAEAFAFGRPDHKRSATLDTTSLDLWHDLLLKGDTRYLGRFLLREPAHKITGAINKETPQRYGFPQRPQYSTSGVGVQVCQR